MQHFISALQLFNRKASELTCCRFVQRMAEGPIKVSYSYSATEPCSHTADIPDLDTFKAAVLDLRFFIQDNEISSFANLAKLFEEAKVSISLVDQFTINRARLNEFLDSKSQLCYNADQLMTYRELLEIVVYGGLAHANSQHRSKFLGIEEIPGAQSYLFFQFSHILIEIIKIIGKTREINLDALNAIKDTQGLTSEFI